MLVRCEKCGYENFPQHRFCGMCGAGLRVPQATPSQPSTARPAGADPAPPAKAAAAAQPSTPKPVTGPSFLGLADEPSQHSDVSYLLEDEPDSSHRGRYLVLIILIAAVAAGAWYWRQDLRSWAGKFAGSPSANSTEAANSSQQASAASPAAAAPAASANPDTRVEKANTGVGDQQATSQAQASPAAAAAPAGAPSAAPEAAQPQQPAPSQQAAQSPQSDNSGPGQSASNESPPAAAAAPAETSATKSPALVRPSKTAALPPTTPAAESDALEAQGENYLYGNGVPANCARAQKSLLAAAARSNAKAQSVLGTMYATGHCATRDLPAAYRWFARALRQDPSNTRYEQDLKVLWGQMTPEERQTALRNEQ